MFLPINISLSFTKCKCCISNNVLLVHSYFKHRRAKLFGWHSSTTLYRFIRLLYFIEVENNAPCFQNRLFLSLPLVSLLIPILLLYNSLNATGFVHHSCVPESFNSWNNTCSLEITGINSGSRIFQSRVSCFTSFLYHNGTNSNLISITIQRNIEYNFFLKKEVVFLFRRL